MLFARPTWLAVPRWSPSTGLDVGLARMFLEHIILCLCACQLGIFRHFLTVISAAEIRRLSVPRWILNGTDDGVVLDCEYVYNENDLRLVVKWFFNDDLEPLYQWIPELNVRHVSGILYGRVDMDFSINPFDPYSQYRALRIKSPSPDLSGTYTCLVTSLAGQDSRQQDMTVYVPAKEFRFNFDLNHRRHITFSCTAEGIYPEPRMELLVGTRVKRTKQDFQDKKVVLLRNSTFDVVLNKTIDENKLSTGGVTVVECLLEIPGSPYRRAKRITYFSGSNVRDWSSEGTRSNPLAVMIPLLLHILLDR